MLGSKVRKQDTSLKNFQAHNLVCVDVLFKNQKQMKYVSSRKANYSKNISADLLHIFFTNKPLGFEIDTKIKVKLNLCQESTTR